MFEADKGAVLVEDDSPQQANRRAQVRRVQYDLRTMNLNLGREGEQGKGEGWGEEGRRKIQEDEEEEKDEVQADQ